MSAQAKFPRTISAHKIFAYGPRLVWQNVSLRRAAPKTSLLGWHSMPRFDVDEESLFWRERNAETLKPLKLALLLGALAFLAFVILDAFTKALSASEVIGRGLIVLVLVGLFGLLNRPGSSQSTARVAPVANLAAGISALDLIGTLLIDANPAFYAEAWPGLLPIYFVTYGQLVMPIAETLVFGWLTLIALPVTGYLIGVEAGALLPSCLMLLIVNLFGMYTRYQLEAYSRRSFYARRTAESAAEEKAEFMRQASHNLRQPLQALSCYSSVLDNALSRNHLDEVRPTAGKLGAAIDELNDSFNRILDIANLETGRQIPCITDVELNPLLAALENQFAPQATKNGLKLKVKLRTRPPFTVQSDANILRQILGNLIDNAVKYTASGWVLIWTTPVSPTRLELHVRDTGIGIPEEESEAIFKEFHRYHCRQHDPHAHGLGIGLAYAKKAVERLPGHAMTFQSKSSRGTDFRIGLPIAISSQPAWSLAPPVQGDLAGRYVLLVDDDEDVLNALAQKICCWGGLVDKAGSLADVRQVLAESLRPPDLLITDFYLGRNETAHDIFAALNADCGPVPAVILSARTIPEADKMQWSEPVFLLRKPASAATLLETMIRALENQAISE